MFIQVPSVHHDVLLSAPFALPVLMSQVLNEMAGIEGGCRAIAVNCSREDMLGAFVFFLRS